MTIVAVASAALRTKSELPERPVMVTAGELAAQKSEEKYGLLVLQTRLAASVVDESLRLLECVTY